jgi:uncharacterized membrane protein YgdD (TMEM256/DUF423 family)
MHRKFLLSGILLAGLAVVFGAFGAHALKAILAEEKLAIFETGVRYQFMHAIALIVFSYYLVEKNKEGKLTKSVQLTGSLFLLGTLFFSGSLYALAFQPLLAISYTKWIGPVTPMGGLCYILGWGLWAHHVYTDKVDN